MDSDSWLLLVLFFICVICSGYFSSAETCFSSVDKMKIKTYADDGNKRAKKALYVINNFDSALTTILIGTNVLHTAAASIATVVLAKYINSSNFSLYCTLISTGFLFLFSEVIPKSFATDRCYKLSLSFAGSLIFFMKVFKPLSFFFTKVSTAFTNLFSKEEAPTITEEELYDIIDTAEEEGVVDEEQSDLIKSALDFSATTAGDVMTMIDDVLSIDIKTPPEEIISIIKKTTHSRIPVYRGSKTNIIGVLQVRKYIKAYLNHENVSNLRRLMTPSFYILKNNNIDDLLNAMTQHKAYLAVVREKDSKEAVGIVTIEDFLEELVGEIWDEDDIIDDNFVKLGGNKFLVNVNMPVNEMFSRIGYKPVKHYNKTVLNWFNILAANKEIDEDLVLTCEDLEVQIESMDEDNHFNKVIVHIVDKDKEVDE